MLVVCYDIVDDRRRSRLHRRMREFLPRVQKSVFEGDLTEDRIVDLREMIRREIDPVEDTVRIYRLCGRCHAATELFGTGVYIEPEEADEIA